MRLWNRWKYKNLTLFFLSVLLAFVLSRFETFHTFLLNLGNLGYFGAFIAGMLFVSTFTVSIGIVILFVLVEKISPIEIALIAGLGAVLGDFTIFHIIKDELLEEITPLYYRLGGTHITAILKSKYFSWALPVIGAIIIASPLPDEVGVSLMGVSKMRTSRFLLISFVLNSSGIFLVVVTKSMLA